MPTSCILEIFNAVTRLLSASQVIPTQLQKDVWVVQFFNNKLWGSDVIWAFKARSAERSVLAEQLTDERRASNNRMWEISSIRTDFLNGQIDSGNKSLPNL